MANKLMQQLIRQQAPGRLMQYCNKLIHIYPMSSIAYTSFWAFILIVVSPFLGWFIFFKNVVFCLDVIMRLLLGIACHERGWRVSALQEHESENKDLAVCITGCDSGFGKDLAYVLAEKGFQVFAGCLTDDGEKHFKGRSRIVAFHMDVTNDATIDNSVSRVLEWISDSKALIPRYFHALINNAGVGSFGLVDWLDMSSYRRDMEVNYFGMVSTTKKFLAIFKSQAASGRHPHTRIVNVVSVAGLVAGHGFSSYSGSKFAAEAFSSSLRLELKPFGVTVVTINPSCHKTPLAEGVPSALDTVWANLPEARRREYGNDYYMELRDVTVRQCTLTMWDPKIVVDQVVDAVEIYSPESQIAVGMDAKFFILLLRHLPVWAQDFILTTTCTPKGIPNAMLRAVYK